MGYVFLAVAIGLEILATSFLKQTNGFTVLVPSLICAGCYAACFWCLAQALFTVNLSVAYATWCAAGIVATTVISVLAFHEKLNAPALIGVALCVVGVILVNLNTSGH